MEQEQEKRRHRRLPLRLAVSCHKVGHCAGKVYTGDTVNVSPGGMLLEINSHQVSEGELVSIEMSVPPTEGLLEYGGRFSSYARVIRVQEPHSARTARRSTIAQTIALEFCESPKLQV